MSCGVTENLALCHVLGEGLDQPAHFSEAFPGSVRHLGILFFTFWHWYPLLDCLIRSWSGHIFWRLNFTWNDWHVCLHFKFWFYGFWNIWAMLGNSKKGFINSHTVALSIHAVWKRTVTVCFHLSHRSI